MSYRTSTRVSERSVVFFSWRFGLGYFTYWLVILFTVLELVVIIYNTRSEDNYFRIKFCTNIKLIFYDTFSPFRTFRILEITRLYIVHYFTVFVKFIKCKKSINFFFLTNKPANLIYTTRLKSTV